MARLAVSPPRGRGRYATALVLLLTAAAADMVSARYYGGYNRAGFRGGGVSVSRTTTVSAGGGRGFRTGRGYGRRLLDADADAAAADVDVVAAPTRRLLQVDTERIRRLLPLTRRRKLETP